MEQKRKPASRFRRSVGVLLTVLISALFAFAAADTMIDEAHFPDAAFRAYVTEFHDRNRNGILEPNETENVIQMDVKDRGISSLQGIEHFEQLTWLNCARNQLTGMDLSRNTALKRLSCSFNQLTDLKVSACIALESLDCSNN